MPFSQSRQLSALVDTVEYLRPTSILDVGTGMGVYGFLLRTFLEDKNLFDVQGTLVRRKTKEEWSITIDGIEGYAGYLTPVHDYAYNRIQIGNALELLPQIPTGAYELVMAIDILEHFTTEEGERFLAECKRIARRMALISTPKDFIEQHVEANPFEDHKSLWTLPQLQALGYVNTVANAESWIVTT
jgi:hypothetical protein